MRLLNVHDFKFQRYKDPPPYAVLSHRWSTDEWLLKDVEQRRHTAEFRLTKIHGFAEHIKKHYSIDWIWIDSCCINQDSAAELSESINSMCKWYKNATVCIAYLIDIDTQDFTTSVWFTRGWTLQELLIPETVVFLTTKWKTIGNKESHKAAIASRTGIPLDVLIDFNNSQKFSKEQRLQWMEGRETQRDEDMFYALFGIFGVTPGANYGEGTDGARQRLFEAIDRKDGTHKFTHIMNYFDLPDPWAAHENLRHRHVPGTGWLKWTEGHVWLHGKSGCGKTFLAFAVIEDQPSEGFAFFYFPGTYQDLLKTLVRQLGWRELEHSHRQPTITEMENILIKVSESAPVRIVLDGLDQRKGGPDPLDRLKTLVRKANVKRANVRLFVTSRETPDIREMMKELGSQEIHITPETIEDDIRNYTVSQLGEELAEKVLQHADGMFTWVVHMVDELSRVETLNNITLSHCPAGLDEVYADRLRLINRPERLYAKAVLQWLAYARADLTVDQLLEAKTIREDRVDVNLRGEPGDLMALSGLIDVSNGTVKLVHPSLKGYLESHQLPNDVIYFQLDSRRGHHFLEQRCITYLIHGQGPLSSYALDFHHHTKEVSDRPKLPNTNAIADLLLEDGQFEGSYPSLMHAATNRGHAEIVKLMIKHGIQIDNDLLNIACTKGHLAVVEVLLDAGASVEPEGPLGHPLNAAVAKNHVPIVKLLLARKIKHQIGQHSLALQLAAEYGNVDVVKAFLATEDVTAGAGIYGGPLQAAAAKGHANVVSLLISAGADKEACIISAGTALCLAADRGHADVVALLTNAGANIEVKTGGDWTPLSIASSHGRTSIMKLLLKAGAETESVAVDGRTPLFHATASGHLRAVQLLLSAKAEVDVIDSAGMTPIHTACCHDRPDLIELLLPRTRALDLPDHDGWTPIHAAVARGFTRSVQKVLAAGANANIPNRRGCTPLITAIHNGHWNLLKPLCDADVDVNIPNREGWTAFHEVVRHESVEWVIQLALTADINAPNNNDDTPLHTAASQESTVMLELLLTFPRVKIVVPNKQRMTPLHIAVSRGHLNNTKLLLDAWPDVDGADGNGGFTSLAIAVKNNHAPMVKLLLDVGADPTIRNAWGDPPVAVAAHNGNLEILQLFAEHIKTLNNKTPLFIASKLGHVNIVRLLQVASSAFVSEAMLVHDTAQRDHIDTPQLLRDTLNVANDDGHTPLFAAAANGHIEIVELLLEAGANITKDKQGWTPFTIACRQGHTEIVKMLLLQSDTITRSETWIAVDAAASKGHADTVELLLHFGELDIPHNRGTTPAMTAPFNGHVRVKRLLDTDFSAALHSACREGHTEVVRFLLRHGGVERVHKGRTPLMEASKHGRRRVAQLLIDRGASVAGSLNLAAAHGHFQIVKLLIEGAEEAEAQEMARSITNAAVNGHVEIVRLLLAQGVNGEAALQVAAAHGRLKSVRLLIESCRNYDNALKAALKAGHTEVVELLTRVKSSTPPP